MLTRNKFSTNIYSLARGLQLLINLSFVLVILHVAHPLQTPHPKYQWGLGVKVFGVKDPTLEHIAQLCHLGKIPSEPGINVL